MPTHKHKFKSYLSGQEGVVGQFFFQNVTLKGLPRSIDPIQAGGAPYKFLPCYGKKNTL